MNKCRSNRAICDLRGINWYYRTFDRGLHSRWGYWDLGVDSASKRIKYQGYLLGSKDVRCQLYRNSGSLSLVEP